MMHRHKGVLGEPKFKAKKVMKFNIRHAQYKDIETLIDLIHASVRGLQTKDYSSQQLEGALKSVYGVDSQLILDGTYFLVESFSSPDNNNNNNNNNNNKNSNNNATTIVGCGGWSKRKTLYGADHWTEREDTLLNPQTDPAKIRAFFIHPDWARQGIGSMILERCEAEARDAGFLSFEMGATLTGVPMYAARGYKATENLSVPLANGETLAIVKMTKNASEV